MADSWAGVAINVMTQPLSEDHQDEVSVRHIPASNISYLDLAGQKPVLRRLAMWFASYSAFLTFAALRNTSGTLVYTGGTFASTVMTNPRITRIAPSGYVEATAEFLT